MEYRSLEDYTKEEILDLLDNGTKEELVRLPLSIGMNYPHWKFAQTVCCKLCENEDNLVRANAISGFGYIAITKGVLEKEIVKPYIINELKNNKNYKKKIINAIEDINIFLGWNLGKIAIHKNRS